ncbi:AraC family transcriptional regulator [Paraburkholderia sp. J12]|uniref:AraC family transcriptional regulator n=1 Tax=Paraburkholderia sp. J12 TaxID=2805432 RepID=UPI002ABE2054|nr:AraC family transcriptional regulator [Paraburkholderia sp. J12]
MEGDPLSDFLRLADAQPVVSGGFSAGGPWAIRFPRPDYLKFFALVKGHCWLRIDGNAVPLHVEEGDVFLLTIKQPFVLAADLTAVPQDAAGLFAGKFDKVASLGEGDDCVQIGGHVRLDPTYGERLANVLPPVIHIRAAAKEATVLTWLLGQLVHERKERQPGAALVSAQLAQLLFVQILRAHLQTSESLPCGWLRAISDRRLAPAMSLMHQDPGRCWNLDELAKAAAMSRTSFAVHFKSVAGIGPLTYLTQWRMLLAQRALRTERTRVSVLANHLGYSSESAFSNAFRRVTGISPARYRNASRTTTDKAANPPSPDEIPA